MRESAEYLDPRILASIEGLELRARLVVQGTISGLNRSLLHGLSVEFAEHRPYAWGDDLRHIDWKVWARADRLYVKLYEEETNMRAYFLLDSSNSMRYASGAMSKYDYACTLAASLAYLLLNQQDACGLVLFNSAVRAEAPPRSSPDQLSTICRLMEAAEPRERTAVGPVLHEIAERIAPRSMVILVSDLLAPAEDVVSGLQHLRYNRHEVIVWHVLDRAELDFPFDGNVKFEGLESDGEMKLDARQVRRAYLGALGEFRKAIEDTCGRLRADYCPADTSELLDRPLARFLVARHSPARAP